MVDYSATLPQLQQFQPPNMLAMAQQASQMQAANMLMQQRAADLQKENALRAAAAQYGVNSKAYAEAAGRIDPEAGLKAFTYQRQQQAAGASAAAAARAAELDRIRTDSATVDLVNKHGDSFEKALRVVQSYPEDQRAGVYGKLYEALPPKLKNFYNPTYSPEAVDRAMMTTAEIVSSLKPKEAQYLMGPAGPIAINKNTGTFAVVPESGVAPVANQLPGSAPGGMNALAPAATAPLAAAPLTTTPPMPSLPETATPAPTTLAGQRTQVAQEKLAEKGAEQTQKLEIDKRFSETERAQARQEFDKTLANIVTQYKDLGAKGMLVKAGETTLVNRAKAAAATAAPGLTTVLSPERGEPVSTLSNMRQTMLSALMGATGMSAKNIDSNAEMRAYLNSLSNPGQSVKTIVDTLNNLSERFGTNMKLKETDLTAGRAQNPSSNSAAPVTNIHDAADAILRGGTR